MQYIQFHNFIYMAVYVQQIHEICIGLALLLVLWGTVRTAFAVALLTEILDDMVKVRAKWLKVLLHPLNHACLLLDELTLLIQEFSPY